MTSPDDQLAAHLRARADDVDVRFTVDDVTRRRQRPRPEGPSSMRRRATNDLAITAITAIAADHR
jgi:hypothetical protein